MFYISPHQRRGKMQAEVADSRGFCEVEESVSSLTTFLVGSRLEGW